MAERKTTKQCPHCKSEIPLGAKKCSQCQGDLRSWFRRHPVLTSLGVLIAFVVVVSMIAGGGEETGIQQKVGEAPQQETQKPEITEYKVGDKVKMGPVIITVNEVEFSQGGQFSRPAEGNEWVNLNITLENTENRDLFITTLGQMFIRDGEGNSYQVHPTDKVMENPGFNLDGTLLAQSKRTGWVGFEVKKGASNLRFQYKDIALWGDKAILISLGR